MNEDNTQKLAKLKKIGKILKAASLIASLVLIPAILIFLFVPVTNLMSDVASKYTRGYNYYGWQMTFLGCGYPPFQILCLFEEPGTAAGDYIPDKYDFGFNIVTTMALFIPFVAMIIAGLVGMKMKNRGKAVCEFAVAAAIIVSVTILLNVAPLSVNVASSMGAGTGFKNTFLEPAIAAGTYKTLAYPIILFVIGLLIALLKIARGVFLLYQRNVARKLKNQN